MANGPAAMARAIEQHRQAVDNNHPAPGCTPFRRHGAAGSRCALAM
jgi:hypothetical protein